MIHRFAARAVVLALAVTLAASLAAPVFAQGRGNDNQPGNSGGGNSGGNSGNSGNDNRGNSGNSGNSGSGQTATASATPTRTASSSGTTSSTTTTTAPTGTTATTTDDGKGKGKDDKDNRDDEKDNHGGAVRDTVQDARESGSGGGLGREVSEAARSALGKPEQAVVSVTGLLTALTETSATIAGPAGETAIVLTETTRIKTDDDSDAAVADLAALIPVRTRARGRMGSDGALVATRIEYRGDRGEGGMDGELETDSTSLEGVVDAVSTTGFTLVTRPGTAPTGTTTTTTAPTGSTATTTTTAPSGTTATTTAGAPTGSTSTTTATLSRYNVLVTPETKIVRNEAPATLAQLQSGDDVEARGTLDGATLTATRVLADGPVGTPPTTTR